MSRDLQVRTAHPDDLAWIHELRHRVYAGELGQHAQDPTGRLHDDLDGDNAYLVAAEGDVPIGFVSLTPPWVGRFGLDKYVTRTELPLLDEHDVFEVRILTVEPGQRSSGIATLLMYAALRWVASHGGRTIVAMGRNELLDMYRAVGLTPLGRSIRSGAVDFEVMSASVADVTALALGPYAGLVERWRADVDWCLDIPFATRPDGCEHGGASFAAIGSDFGHLERRSAIVAADVLDAWFPPAPRVTAALAEDTAWLTRTSPPSGAEGLLAEIAVSRGIPVDALAIGAGSSDLIHRAFAHWLTPTSRVLLVDPSYGEYAHVTERIIGCEVDRFPVRRSDGWRIDPARFAAVVETGRYDLVVVVNPNNPTGRHAPAAELRAVIDGSQATTRWWIDEAYIGYVDLAESLVGLASIDPRVVVCTSMSKMYALSGVRAAFIAAEPSVASDLRRRTPPWQVSLPAQIAAVEALRDPDHYRAYWQRTHDLRRGLAADLAALGGVEVEESVANFLTITLPADGPSAARFVQDCRRLDVYLRDLSPLSAEYRGRTVRVAVKDDTENARIVAACRSVLHSLGADPVPSVSAT